MLNISNKMYFDSDKDFFDFAVVPVLVTKEIIGADGTKKYTFDYNLSWEYENALKNNKIFVIKDPNSQICKHQAVSFRTITKPIQNLCDCVQEAWR